jgi:F-type H+-transporting ATPase subunit delta
MRPSTTARRYARAAFEIAEKDGNIKSWIADLQAASDVIEEPSMVRFFRDPKVGREEQLAALRRLEGKITPHVLNLLRMLAVRHRLYLLPAILRELASLEREAEGIVEADVTVARAISDQEKNEIAGRLQEMTGKRVELEIHMDPRILGGVIVRIGDRLIDASIRGRLERLRQEMAA